MSAGLRSAVAAASASTFLILALACAPAVDPDSLYGSLVSPDVEVRQEAAEKVETLVQKGDSDVFVRGLNSPNLVYRAQSIIYLGRIGTPKARKALLDLLAVDRRMMLPFNPVRMRPQREETDSRILVAELLRRAGGDPAAIGILLRGVEEGQVIESLTGTCYAVGALRDPAGLAFLDKAARHPETGVVRAAIQSAGQFNQAESNAILRRAISHPVVEVRADVLSSLSSRNDADARGILETIGESDPSPDLRASAFESLARFKPAEVVPYLIDRFKDAPETARPALLESLGHLTGQALGPKADPWTRWWAKQATGAPAR
jgi:HEAT repeat protein